METFFDSHGNSPLSRKKPTITAVLRNRPDSSYAFLGASAAKTFLISVKCPCGLFSSLKMSIGGTPLEKTPCPSCGKKSLRRNN